MAIFPASNLASVSLGHVPTKRFGDSKDIFVAPAAHIHANDVIRRQVRCHLGHMGQCMAWFKCWDDAFGFAAKLKRIQRLDIRDRDILRATYVVQPGMFGPDAGVIQPG